MKIDEFFAKLEKEFGITPYDYCRIRPLSLSTIRKYIEGASPNRHVAENIERITDKGSCKVTMKDMGFKD